MTAIASGEQPKSLPLLNLAALGIVFGDIGTSPLYTFKTILAMTAKPDHGAVFGVLSLVLWTLFLITDRGDRQAVRDLAALQPEALQP